MIKLSALNNDSEEESGSEEEVTKEALEQIALQQYAKALELHRKGNLNDATQLLKDLLDTELLYDIKKLTPSEKVSGPLLNLKYLCYKNLASMLSESNDDVDAAIEAYISASELDDTDITLWHRLGQLCMRAQKYEMALHAFQRGAECNPRHWPCLDKIVTLLLGLDHKEECISTIHDTLQLDPGYLRGLAYRKHIYTTFPYIKDFLEYLNPIYKWNEKDDEPFDEVKAAKLIKEAEDIQDIVLEQHRAQEFKYTLPELKLKKPISELSWNSVGNSLVHMHHYMTENFFSHACFIELVFDKEEKPKSEPMDVCEEVVKEADPEEVKLEENITDNEKNSENVSESENNDISDKDKAATDTEKVESDVEVVVSEPTVETQPELKIPRKPPVRRRGSDLSFLQQWEWCNKRRSGRKKPVVRQEDDNIYDTLRRMVPLCLVPEIIQKKENRARDTSPDTSDLGKLFDDAEKQDKNNYDLYFGTETEQKDVKEFINRFTENKRDIIDMLKDYLSILAVKWKSKWPEDLADIFVEANKCYNNHIDVPTCTEINRQELIHYCLVNIMFEEFSVNKKCHALHSDDKQVHDLSVIEAIGITLSLQPHIFVSTDCLDLMLRYLWVKLHIHILNKNEEFALDCLYQLLDEFEAMGEHHDTYSVDITNFTFKPLLNETEILAYIKFLERNKRLSTVMDLYERGNYEEVLSIVIESFEHCKNMPKNEEEEMSLDFAVQLSIILDTYWALDKVDECFQWSLTCLHEALKHFFRCTSGSPDYEQWTLTVVKILCCMEHIFKNEGLTCLETIPRKDLSQGLEDLIRIIGHQVETNSTDIPFATVVPWIILHYILQREEDQGRGRVDKDKVDIDEIPNPLLVLFIAHEQLGQRGWCSKSDSKLLYFTLDTVVPRLRSPVLSKSLEQVCQYMEQCVYCLYSHPNKKNNRLKHLIDHNATAQSLDWPRAQQVYEIFRPPILPALEGKISGITLDTEQLYHRILALLPPDLDPQKYVPDVDKYIKGTEQKLPMVPPLLPYKMRDIYFLLGDYYFKKEERKMAVKFNMMDVVINNDRLESWAQISLAKAVNLERILNSCKNIKNEREILIPAKSIIRCFKRSLELDPTHYNMWIEYGIFTYTFHSFCSRLLKQASESLSMEDFASLEKQKDDMLDTTQKCFTTVLNDLNSSHDDEKANEETWLHFYMLGKVAEKRNKPPSVYLDYYMQAVKSLQETDATYPLKINYNAPTHLCIEVLEIHYRIHASILKYIEQHENKPIPAAVGKVFSTCIEEWKKGPFTKKPKKDGQLEEICDSEPKPEEPVHAANILKRSISDAGEEETQEAKRLKLESAAAKVRRSASYDTERITPTTTSATATETTSTTQQTIVEVPNDENKSINTTEEKEKKPENVDTPTITEEIKDVSKTNKDENKAEDGETKLVADVNKTDFDKKEDSSSSTSSSSSDSSSSESSSDSSSDSSRESSNSTKSASDSKPLSDDEIMTIISACLDALEDCASRFAPHYKAIYRLAHYHFYHKKGKDIERCRDLMLSSFTSRTTYRLSGLFSERKPSNFFNNIWKIPLEEVDRAGGFVFHMSRSILLTMEILKEIDDHKTLLDLSLYLQRIPEPDKTYLRDSDREELAQQAFSLCVQSLKGQVTKFSQQADLKSNEVEREALKSLMLDIYRAYQRSQKSASSKQFTNLLIEAYKLITLEPIAENTNFVDISMKYCQRLIQKLKHEATMASLDKSQNTQKKQAAKLAETTKPVTSTSTSTSVTPITTKSDYRPAPISTALPSLPKMSSQEMAAAFQNYLPMVNDALTQQNAAALTLSYLSNMSALAGYPPLTPNFQSSLQNTLQSEIYRQILGTTLPGFGLPPAKKQKRAPKSSSTAIRPSNMAKPTKSFSGSSIPAKTPAFSGSLTSKASSASFSVPSSSKATSSKATSSFSAPLASTKTSSSFSGSLPSKLTATSVITNAKSASAPLAPSMGTVLPSLPASMSANLTSFGGSNLPSNFLKHVTHQTSPNKKTLQEKLAERQKYIPGSKASHEINASISKLPSSLTITKTSVPKPVPPKKHDVKKSLPLSERPKPIQSDEVIILDDD